MFLALRLGHRSNAQFENIVAENIAITFKVYLQYIFVVNVDVYNEDSLKINSLCALSIILFLDLMTFGLFYNNFEPDGWNEEILIFFYINFSTEFYCTFY